VLDVFIDVVQILDPPRTKTITHLNHPPPSLALLICIRTFPVQQFESKSLLSQLVAVVTVAGSKVGVGGEEAGDGDKGSLLGMAM